MSECQTAWVQMRLRDTRRLIQIQAVCIYAYGTIVVLGGLRVKMGFSLFQTGVLSLYIRGPHAGPSPKTSPFQRCVRMLFYQQMVRFIKSLLFQISKWTQDKVRARKAIKIFADHLIVFVRTNLPVAMAIDISG